MKKTSCTMTRRNLLKKGLFSLAALPLGMGVMTPQVFASSLPLISEDHPQARALNYVHVAASASGHPSFKADAYCDNCRFWVAATNGCTLIPNFSFEPKGWCQAWVSAG
ncbi:high-potential iron-sulfur protein [Marinospirillum alkaliphilum]|uniref:High-potential iron-sulfur protein n=1 Tax=Marinospirillum alkaliphilum DSM 21637 TaxID=1122209 RepID=A0A1K1X3I9_9GAMM|nr:high-potential iron-sulfur protein [Marinospirillum alkaliphilum]SFX43724.1 High potential iron-sulfur protein [Marinospirillum alkaliphilum DSM 21637]